MRIANPKPIQPVGGRIDGETVHFQTDQWVCRLTPWSAEMFRHYIMSMGVSKRTVEVAPISEALSKVAVFQIELKNLGSDLLVFNPDQILLESDRVPAGVQVDSAWFWPTNLPGRDEDRERFARIFSRGTVEVSPGETHAHLAVFMPARHKFPKRITLQVNRIYYGIQNHDIKCRFDVRYPKK